MTDKANRQEQLDGMLQGFHLPSFKKHYMSYARKSELEKLDHVAYLFELSKTEHEDRYNRRTERLIKEAKLPGGKRIENFELSHVPSLSPSRIDELATGAGLDLCENVLIFGNPGTGKTHLAVSLAREWCLRGRHAFFTTAAALVQDLLKAKRDLKLNSLLKKLDRFEALIIDDLSYIPQEREETDVLFVLLAERYERRSVVITSNLPFSKWDTVFKDPITAMAAVDRLVHHSTILELNGESYRATTASKKKAASKSVKQKEEP
ncbi:MAG: IS21-like element helper ATPase IstB [Candidatus Obscuribacterales bacterium]|nr:IS21-like element helper ATPase IstB [Candidatus Obscuribacterales bacterium]